jgi:hypothetical protein
MRLTVTIDVEHDVLDVPTLLFALPLALNAVATATAAGVAETGPYGMDVQPPGVQAVAKVHFRIAASETVRRFDANGLPPVEATP